MSRRRHFHRRRQKQFCRSAVIWACAVATAILSLAELRHARPPGSGGIAVPAYASFANAEAPGDLHPTGPRVTGDGMLDAPRAVMKLVPALASEAGLAVRSGDAREALLSFAHWLRSGEALRSGPFWLFWSVMGTGIGAMACALLVNRFADLRHQRRVRGAGGPEVTDADPPPPER